MKKLIDICDIQYGYAYAFDSAYFTENSCYPPLARIRDVKRGYSETYYSGGYSEEYILASGDLLVGMDGEFNIARWKCDGAAYARQLPKKDCRFLEKYTRSFNYQEQSCLKTEKDVQTYGIKTYFCSNVCAAYDHRIYDEIGGFPEHAIFNEDMIYAGWMVKKGYGVAYVSEARVYHSHNYTCMQQFHRNFDLGVSQAEHPEVFEGVPSEGEGIRLVKKSMAYLLKTGHIWLIPGLFLQSASKYAGYFLGKRYKKLPEKMIRSCTMNPEYWKKNK